jgi:5-methyltetrahydrofolate--homocysteine methyltransferase
MMRAMTSSATTVGKDIAVGDAGGDRGDAHKQSSPSPPFTGTRRRVSWTKCSGCSISTSCTGCSRRAGGDVQGDGEERDSTDIGASQVDAKEQLDQATGRYGYFPAQSQGNDVIIYDPAAYASDGGSLREIARFHFPRMVGRERLCLADYIRSVDSGDVDVVPLQIVTVGSEATRQFEQLQAKNEYSEAFYSHGLSVESAEAVAEWAHRRIKKELGAETGKRYSWGYGACPDLDDHATVFKLLPAREALGMDLTEAFQLTPEQSTAAVIIHHPEAKYYAVRGTSPGAATEAEAAVA